MRNFAYPVLLLPEARGRFASSPRAPDSATKSAKARALSATPSALTAEISVRA
jgi:hypothetical protein